MLFLLLACKPSPDSTPKSDSDSSDPNTTDSVVIIDDSSGTTDDSSTTDTGVVDLADYEALYDVSVLHTVEISLDQATMDALTTTPEVYTAVDVVVDGTTFQNVGVRLDGQTDAHPLATDKPSLRIKLNEFEAHNIGGTTRLYFDAMHGDASQAKAVMALWLWREAGQWAPRATFTNISYVLNGETTNLGLYASIEWPDGNLLDHHFTDASGDLWYGDNNSDFTSGAVAFFDLEEGDGSAASLDAAWQAINSPTADYFASADTVIQADQFLQYWAWRVATGSVDGYPYELDDFYMYADPAEGGRFAFMPWDLEKSWDLNLDWDALVGMAAFRCQQDAGCLGRFRDAVTDALQTYEQKIPDAEAETLFSLTDDAVYADNRRGSSYTEVITARSSLKSGMVAWPNRVRQQVGVP